MKSWRRNGGVGETLESEKWWSRRNGGVGETLESEKWWSRRMVESEKHWSRRNCGVGEMVKSEKWWNIATLESEKWWIAVGVGEMVEHNHDGGCSEMVAVKLVDYSIVIY